MAFLLQVATSHGACFRKRSGPREVFLLFPKGMNKTSISLHKTSADHNPLLFHCIFVPLLVHQIFIWSFVLREKKVKAVCATAS